MTDQPDATPPTTVKASEAGTFSIDIAQNRSSVKYSRRENIQRALWMIGGLVFRAVPRPLYRVRSSILRLFGARIGPHCQIYPTVRIFLPSQLEIGAWTAVGDRATLYNLGSIRIGDSVTISQGAHLCAGSHNYSDPSMPLIRAEIIVENSAWICAEAFVGPGVTIGRRAVVGARAVVVRSVEPGVVVGGNPARVIKSRNLAQQDRNADA
jgi:putative colanic acid biosynthesis acetyltransferase WcaF